MKTVTSVSGGRIYVNATRKIRDGFGEQTITLHTGETITLI